MSLKPLIKWAGGKEQELKFIIPYLPKTINRYFEPFIGGGALYFNMKQNEMFINDKSNELIALYNCIKNNDEEFYKYIDLIIKDWNEIDKIIDTQEFLEFYKNFNITDINFTNGIGLHNNLKIWIEEQINKMTFILKLDIDKNDFIKELERNIFSKIKRVNKINDIHSTNGIGLHEEEEKMEEKALIDSFHCALKGSYYMYIRNLYNKSKDINAYHTSLFFFIRNLSYSGMFRYNKNNEFNVPYGGISYNNKDLSKKITYFKSSDLLEHLNKTTIYNEDFEDFFKKSSPKENDFIFLDPPYDSEFSKYANNEFNKNDQERLANYLINECKANWMIVIKNTDFIYNLYNKENVFINSFDKSYAVNFKNRNDRTVKHLMITNYKI